MSAADDRAMRDGTLAYLIAEIKDARAAGTLPPELEERAKLAEREQRRREACVGNCSDVRGRILSEIWDKAIERWPDITIDQLLEIHTDACKQMRWVQ